MTTPRGFRDRADDSLFTLLGDVPELVRNLVVAEIDAAKKWVAKAAKNAGIGTGWVIAALFVLFWTVPAFFAFVIIGLASWWPLWVAALVVFAVMLVIAVALAGLAFLSFRKIGKGENPGQAVKHDIDLVKEAGDDF